MTRRCPFFVARCSMENPKSYTELDVWKVARELTNSIYTITKDFPQHEVFGLSSQMRRCAVSVPSTIAEGCGRNSAAETIRFLYIARGSLYELETQCYLAFDQNYLQSNGLEEVLEQITKSKQMLNGFIRYYEKLK